MREYFLEDGCHNVAAEFCLRSGNDSDTLLGVEDGVVDGWVAEEMIEELCNLTRGEILVVERRFIAHRNHSIVEISLDELGSLIREFSSGSIRRHYGSSEDEAFERAQVDAVAKPQQVKVAKDVAVALVDRISEAVGEEGVVCEALGFLDEKSERER